MDRRTFITSAAAAAGMSLIPTEALAEPMHEFYSCTFDTDFLELPVPKPGTPFRPIAPLHPVKMSWVNEQIIAKAAPGTVIEGWDFLLDEPILFPEGSDGITLTGCTFKATPEYGRGARGAQAALQVLGCNHSVINCTFDFSPEIG